jgi:hypothetical protein
VSGVGVSSDDIDARPSVTSGFSPGPRPTGTDAAEQTDHAYLCYSVGGDPYVAQTKPFNDARILMAAGYWTASALPGNVAGGNNVGGYHLVCGESRRFGPGNAPFAKTYIDNNGQAHPFTPGLQRRFIGQYPLSD